MKIWIINLMNEKKINQIITYLSKLGTAKFYPHDYDASLHLNAFIEFTSDIEMAEGLQKIINDEVYSLENKNPTAKIEFKPTLSKGKKTRYTAEIVPKSDKKEEMIYQTERFLTVLPKAFRNIRQKHIDYRKVGKKVLE